MLPSMRSSWPNGRCTATEVAASSRQYEGPVIPQSAPTKVASGGAASTRNRSPGPVTGCDLLPVAVVEPDALDDVVSPVGSVMPQSLRDARARKPAAPASAGQTPRR